MKKGGLTLILVINVIFIAIIIKMFRYEYKTITQDLRIITISKTYKIDRLTGKSCLIVGDGNFNCSE